ncbi:MAG: class I SAM-dependent methyltransferase [Candidatus Eremiobacteraeota bacterium]|nr:class I SAM-dependent methyltransferase [Candidatus Eremiobacteraeota bacterium]
MRHAHEHGARQERRFDPARAAMLDDPARFGYLPPADALALLDPPDDAATIVDFGAGTGAYAIEIARALPHARVVAYDNQPEMLALLEAKPQFAQLRNIETALPGALAALRGGVTRVFALNVLHELSLDDLAQVKALLRSEGMLLVVDWYAEAERPVGPPRDHTYTRDEAKARLALAGFAVTEAQRFPYHYALRCTAGEAAA